MTESWPESIAALSEAPRIADEARRIAREVSDRSFEGTASGGGVRATVNGLGVLTEVSIGELARRELDNLTLGDAVVEAIRAAGAAARQAMRDGMAGLTIAGRSLADFLPAELGGAASRDDAR
jgi:DNA-binding protein YbaB